jgi:hypothetical protein
MNDWRISPDEPIEPMLLAERGLRKVVSRGQWSEVAAEWVELGSKLQGIPNPVLLGQVKALGKEGVTRVRGAGRVQDGDY